jgi:ribosome assembly protein RRB1
VNLQEDAFVAHFKYHTGAITSIEWSPHEASTLSVTSADHQLTIWDLSLERDAEEEAEYQALLKQQAEPPADLPPQLLFVHQVRTRSPPIYADGIITESLLLVEIADIDIL